MCGILGIINPVSMSSDLFKSALDLLQHRGPDGYGIWNNQQVWLGHRRLSIIDLSESASQPFVSTCGELTIVFNGEIYNYKSLSEGLTLRTQSDTEVLLEGYKKYGVDFFHHIRGIYAFCIYDRRGSGHCILVRDRAGIKPLYYAADTNGLIFSSEIKSILPLLHQKPSIDEVSLKTYLHLGYCNEPNTIYKGIQTLQPGHAMVLNIETGTAITQVIDEYNFNTISQTQAEALENTEKLLIQATQRNLVADVNINIALSGGIDSSLIYAYANQHAPQPVNGITISADDKQYDETSVAQAYAKHLRAPQQIVSTQIDQKLELLNTLLLHFDQPYADSSFIPFYFLCKAAKEHSTVLIGGDSGDEIHNGYSGFKLLPILGRIQQSVFKYPVLLFLTIGITLLTGGRKRQLKKIRSVLRTRSIHSMHFRWISWFSNDIESYPMPPFKFTLTEPDAQRKSLHLPIEKQLEYDYFNGRMVSDYLRKSDMMSMLNSIEFRVPMLDEDLTQYSLNIPAAYKSDRNTTKKILRTLHARLFPSELSKLKKRGFTIPLDTWLGAEHLQTMQQIIKQSSIVKEYVHEEYISYLFQSIGKEDAYTSRAGVYQKILILYSLAIWHQQYNSLKN